MVNLRIATQNLHWPNNQQQYAKDINKSKDQADVIIFQEVYNAFLQRDLGSDWNVHHPSGGHVGKGDNAVAWRKSKVDAVNDKGVTIIGNGNSANWHKTFTCVYCVFTVDGKKIMIGSLHMPHGVYVRRDAGPGDLYARCATGLAEFWNKQNIPLMIGGDWNKQIKSDPGNLSHRVPARWVGGGNRGIDGFLTHNRIKVGNGHEIPNGGLESDHPVVYTTIQAINAPSEPDAPPDDTPDAGNDQNKDMKTESLKLVTANMEFDMSEKAIKADFEEFNKAWDPDLWMVQEAASHIKPLKEAAGAAYTVVVPKMKSDKTSISSYFIVKNYTFRVMSINSVQVDDKFNVTVVLKHRASGRSVCVTTVHLGLHWDTDVKDGKPIKNARTDTAQKQIKVLAQQVETNGKKANTIAFLGGDFNIDEHVDNKVNFSGFPNSVFAKHDIISIYDELKTPASFGTKGALTVDVIANYKVDTGVKAKQVTSKKSRSDHEYVLGVYKFTYNAAHPDVEPGTAQPGEEPETAGPTQKFEADTGHDEDIDHTDCCGGTEIP